MIRIVYLLTHIQHTAYKYIVINQGPKDELRLIENLRNGYKISTLNHTTINKIGKKYGS